MSKLTLIIVTTFCLVQIGMSAHIVKRDAVEQATAIDITTESFFDTFQSGIKKAFSDDNIEKVKGTLSDIGSKVKDGTVTAFANVKTKVDNFLKKDETSTGAPVPAPAS